MDHYEIAIVDWLKEHPDLSAAQVKDWLLEDYPKLDIGSSTVRSFVTDLRDRYALPKQKHSRQYEAIPEIDMGEQIQVDWGETWQETVTNEKVKLYFICFVLGHSCYKYVEWLDRPSKTTDAFRCHEQAFRFFGGMTKEIMYDQDNIISVHENAGDLLLTHEFKFYRQTRGFEVYLCQTGNHKVHGTTKKRTDSVFLLEKAHLKSVSLLKNKKFILMPV